jgi:hypothetical protein
MVTRDRHWAQHDDERLLRFNDAGIPLPVIAIALGRTKAAIESRLTALKRWAAVSRRSNAGESE